ncbi:MAG: cyclase family protein [Myxococcales bacterium]|nr:cyclase family protein [Myxococcales bacterium]
MRCAPILPAALLAASALLGCASASPHQHGPSDPSDERRAPRVCPTPRYTIVDLTHRLHDKLPVWPRGVGFEMKRLSDHADGYRAHELHMGEDVGTHVDAPAHFVSGGSSAAELAASELVVPVVVIDLRDRVKRDPDYAFSANDIVDWEDAHGPVPVGGLVVLLTGWSEKFGDPVAYLGQDDQGRMHFPGIGKDAAALFVERDVIGVGIDTMSLDPGISEDFPAHRTLLGAGKYAIENLVHLDALPVSGATAIVGVLPIVEGSQAPARVLAMVPEGGEKADEEEAR